MKKRIIICADGTWNRPEKDIKKDTPTNVLKLARAIAPFDNKGTSQQVFYDWGIGSYYDSVVGGITGKGINKNIVDNYRYIVQNYSPGDELFFFGFSRGAYTVRSLCGLINNCGILKRDFANLIAESFNHYKKESKPYSPKGEKSIKFRKKHSHAKRHIAFIGVWDTVGAFGIPLSFMGLLDKKNEFYDTKMGSNIKVARHALAIDEYREDFEPTIWEERENMALKQVWFCGSHSDIGGSYPPNKHTKALLSDIPLKWMIREAEKAGLSFESHLKKDLNPKSNAELHNSRRHIYRAKKCLYRDIGHGKSDILIHNSVKERWDNNEKYRHSSDNLNKYVKKQGWENIQMEK